ncbi:hypothetical protein BJ741DRAFT_603472 [Chytriomyces cf. hyalinus JEL632]|nr:hypothetical protein BJ741DRAFT_603472 [Chytriomyces cf. hyalinus JEL632]
MANLGQDNRLDSAVSMNPQPTPSTTATGTPSKASTSSSRLHELLASLNDFSVSTSRNSLSSSDGAAEGASDLRIDTALPLPRDSTGSAATASPGSSFRRSRSVGGRRDSADTSAMDAVTMYDPRTGLDAPVTLELLQATSMVLSGFLHKLQPSTDASGSRWKQRFVVLSDDGILFIFRSNGAGSATPLTVMPVTGCSSYQDVDEGAWILRVNGDSRKERRSWTFRVESDSMLRTWLQGIHRSISDVESSPSTSISTRAITIAGGTATHPRSTSMPRVDSYTDSLSQYGSTAGSSSSFRSVARAQTQPALVNAEERDAQMKAMHQQYLLSQKAAQEQFALRKEAASLERAESSPSPVPDKGADKVARKASASKPRKQRPMMVGVDMDLLS